jgi:hypothetical protein
VTRGGERLGERGVLLAALLVACLLSMVLQVGLVALVASYAFACRAAIELLRSPGSTRRARGAVRGRRR